jgi:hypothetical protein
MGIKDEAERQAAAYTEGSLLDLYGIEQTPPKGTGQAGQGTGHVGPGTGRVGPGAGGPPAGPGGPPRDPRLEAFHQEYKRFPQSEYEFQTWLANRR